MQSWQDCQLSESEHLLHVIFLMVIAYFSKMSRHAFLQLVSNEMEKM